MSVLQLPAADRDAALGRRNPVAKLGCTLIILIGLFLTLDPVTPALVLVAELIALPALGIRLLTLLRRAWLLLIAAVAVALTNVLFAAPGGSTVLAQVGPFTITERGVQTAIGLTLRLLAVGLPSIAFAASTDPRDLADSLAQQVHAPARFVYATLAALRLIPLLSVDLQMLRMARRSRGVAGGGPGARIAMAGQTTFALLVAAIRRGTRLALAMDARGFDSSALRTAARQQRMHPADWLLLAGTAVAVAVAIAVAVATGAWRWLIS